QLAVVRGEERAQLRRVERRAAADPDDAVEALPGMLDRGGDRLLVRLASDAVVQRRLDAGLPERRLEPLAQPGLGDEAVADDERAGDAEPAKVLARLRRSARPEDDPGAVERDDRGAAHAAVPTGACCTAAIASAIEITSPYFASMSRSEPSCAPAAR